MKWFSGYILLSDNFFRGFVTIIFDSKTANNNFFYIASQKIEKSFSTVLLFFQKKKLKNENRCIFPTCLVDILFCNMYCQLYEKKKRRCCWN